MTRSCEEMAALLTPLADGVLSGGGREAAEAHLAACAACQAVVQRERAVRQLLRARAGTLEESAPPGLRARLARSSPGAGAADVVQMPPRARPRPARAWRMPLAASLLLGALGAGLLGALAPSGTLLAAQLALDHLKCGFLGHDEHSLTPAHLEARWAERHGWAIDVPAAAPDAGLELVGLRRCLFSGGSMAHVMYHFKGHPVSLFVLPEPRQAASALAIMGHDTVTWSAGGHTLALVSDLPATDLAALAARFQQAP